MEKIKKMQKHNPGSESIILMLKQNFNFQIKNITNLFFTSFTKSWSQEKNGIIIKDIYFESIERSHFQSIFLTFIFNFSKLVEGSFSNYFISKKINSNKRTIKNRGFSVRNVDNWSIIDRTIKHGFTQISSFCRSYNSHCSSNLGWNILIEYLKQSLWKPLSESFVHFGIVQLKYIISSSFFISIWISMDRTSITNFAPIFLIKCLHWLNFQRTNYIGQFLHCHSVKIIFEKILNWSIHK